jgi:cob(I)alamin adenosyltransferase
MSIYTRTGDKGETSLFGGKRVLKSNIRVSAYGTIDELNSVLGVVLSQLQDERARDFVHRIQKDLFLLGSALAGAKVRLDGLPKRVEDLEKVIDWMEKLVPELHNFILPDGVAPAALLYFARAIARRAERELVVLNAEEPVNKKILIYINRLSDFLFMLARYINAQNKFTETIWKEEKT